MTDGPTTTLSLREVALRLRRRPPENPDTVIGALQAALARVRWWMRRRTYGGVERLTLGRPGHHGALLIVTLEPERVPGFADPSGKPLQVPVVRLGPGLHDGLRSLLPSEACSLDELPTLFRLLARAPEQTARRPWTASSKIPGGKDGEPDAARSTVPPPIVAPVPISGLALDPGSALARKIAMIRKVGHFATQLIEQGRTARRPLSFEDCLEAWRAFRARAEAGLAPPDLGLYLHVPVCARRCTYCQIPVRAPASRDDIARVLAALEFELAQYEPVMASYPLRALSIGGGTPNLLDEAQCEQLMSHVFRIFRRAPEFHTTVDLSPHAATYEKLRTWVAQGASRMSFGVQTLTTSVLERIHRDHQTFDMVARALENARRAGVGAVCVDLVVGLPGETAASFVATLERIVGLEPDEIQIFRWILEPKCVDYATLGPLSDERLAERERILAAADGYLRSGKLGRAYKGAASNSGLEYISTRADLFHVFGHYETVRSAHASVLGVGLGAFSEVSGALTYGHAVTWDDYVTWPNRRPQLPFVGATVSPTFDMAARWAKSLDAASLDRADFRRDFGRTPEQVFPDEIDFLTRAGWLRLTDNVYGVPTDLPREESMIAGALMFTLDELRSVADADAATMNRFLAY